MMLINKIISSHYKTICILLSILSFSASADSTDEIRSLNNIAGFSVYGNWCGPNHPKDIKNAKNPIDILDNQCKKHDLCYVEKGEFDCSCDRNMVLDIDNTQKRNHYTQAQYLLAQNIKVHFAISPCNGEVANNKILPTRILTNIYQKTKNKALDIYDRFNW